MQQVPAIVASGCTKYDGYPMFILLKLHFSVVDNLHRLLKGSADFEERVNR